MGQYGNVPSLFCAFIGVIQVQLIAAEMFSSMAALETLTGTELKVIHLLRNVHHQELEKLTAAREYILTLRQALPQKWKEANPKVPDPVRAFKIIKRNTIDWHNLNPNLELRRIEETAEQLKKLRTTETFPNDDDLTGAAVGFQRLQRTYRFRAADVAHGRIPLTRRTPEFTAHEALLVGRKHAEAYHFPSANQWVQVAAELCETEKIKTENYAIILNRLHLSGFRANNNVSKALEIARMAKLLDGSLPSIDENINKYSDMIANLSLEERAKMELPAPPHFFTDSVKEAKYDALCRGELIVAKRVLPYQRCYYETHRNPFLLLQPVKTEMVHIDPDIFILHDILRDAELDQVRDVSFEHLHRSTVTFVNGSDGEPQAMVMDDFRVSRTAFINASVADVIGVANKKASLVANLRGDNAENLQVNNYGLAGVYLPHYDSFSGPEKYIKGHPDFKDGDRIATFMYYLTDVEAGGATVFPRINVTVFPEKGAAILWYNIYRDGVSDARAWHSGCPVLAGSKWVANKWFKEVGQDVTRPCGLTKDSPD